jgi:hypothetical protein
MPLSFELQYNISLSLQNPHHLEALCRCSTLQCSNRSNSREPPQEQHLEIQVLGLAEELAEEGVAHTTLAECRGSTVRLSTLHLSCGVHIFFLQGRCKLPQPVPCLLTSRCTFRA